MGAILGQRDNHKVDVTSGLGNVHWCLKDCLTCICI